MMFYTRMALFSALCGSWCWSASAQDGLPPPAPTAEINAAGQAETTPEGMEVLTSGPLHEAFADTVRYNAEPGLTIDREPPQLIEEQPPESRPEGDDVVWIPGYWGWDDETSDFIWITGVYRNRPPGHRWVPGYWASVEGQYQWVSGFWVRDDVTEVQYLPEPPESLDQGPSSPAPSSDYFWNPGCWNWGGSSYGWRAGYWARCQPGWIWTPSYYNWTPRGYVCSYGRWDRPWATRGLAFAPVRYTRPLYLNSGYFYRPWVAFNSGAFAWNLFVRPNYGHYYVGNYWGNRYNQFGYRPWYANNQGRRGYDPFYNYYRWSNGRNNPGWDRDLRNAYAQRERGDFDRPRDFNQYRGRYDRLDERDRTAVTLPQLERNRRGDSPRLVQDGGRNRDQFRDGSRQFRELNERRRETELAGGGRGPNRDGNRPDGNRPGGNRNPRVDAPSRGQLDLPPVARTRTPAPDRSRDQRPGVERPNRGGQTAGNERAREGDRNRQREFTAPDQRNRNEAGPRNSRSFRANPDAGRGESAIPRDLQQENRDAQRNDAQRNRDAQRAAQSRAREAQRDLQSRPDVPRTRQPGNVDRAPRPEFRERGPTPEPRTRSNAGGASSRAAQERARVSAPATRSAPAARSTESRARSGGNEVRNSRPPQTIRQAPTPSGRGGGSRNAAPNVSAPRGGGGGAPAARAPSRGGAGGGAPAARAPSGGGGNRGGGNPAAGGGGGNRGGGNQGGGNRGGGGNRNGR